MWELVVELATASSRVIEVGGTQRLGDPLRARYDYLNADVVERPGTTDLCITSGRLALPSGSRDFGILSYVLSQITERSDRVLLLVELRRIIVDDGRLLLFDDIELTREATWLLPPGTYFHAVRFGRDLLSELTDAGWAAEVVTSCPESMGPEATRELPYLIATASRR